MSSSKKRLSELTITKNTAVAKKHQKDQEITSISQFSSTSVKKGKSFPSATQPKESASMFDKKLRWNPTKRINDSDSEVEAEQAVKEKLIREEFEWIFVDHCSIVTVNASNDAWPALTNYRSKYTLPEDSIIKLKYQGDSYDSRLLCKGPRKKLKGIADNYHDQLRKGCQPDSLEKITFDDMPKLSQEKRTVFAATETQNLLKSKIILGGSRRKNNCPQVEVKVIAKNKKNYC